MPWATLLKEYCVSVYFIYKIIASRIKAPHKRRLGAFRNRKMYVCLFTVNEFTKLYFKQESKKTDKQVEKRKQGNLYRIGIVKIEDSIKKEIWAQFDCA